MGAVRQEKEPEEELEELGEMEDVVKDAILMGGANDPVLLNLIELAMMDIAGRPLFPNPLQEPFFYRKYFLGWVQEGMAEARAAATAKSEIKHKVAPRLGEA